MTQAQLAERANVNKTWISHIESGRVNPAYGTMRRLGLVLDLPLSSIIARAEQLEEQDN